MTSVFRASLWSLALVGVAVLGMFLLRGWKGNAYTFMSIRVVNDTQRTLRIQPCWDLNCDNTIGLPDAIFRPGDSKRVAGKWVNNVPEQVVIGILRPHAEAFHYEGCVLRFFEPGKKVGVIRVSREGPCLNVPTGGAGGG